jgi:hypothetical protein
VSTATWIFLISGYDDFASVDDFIVSVGDFSAILGNWYIPGETRTVNPVLQKSFQMTVGPTGTSTQRLTVTYTLSDYPRPQIIYLRIFCPTARIPETSLRRTITRESSTLNIIFNENNNISP